MKTEGRNAVLELLKTDKTIDKICKSRNRLYKVISKESKSHNYPDHISNDY